MPKQVLKFCVLRNLFFFFQAEDGIRDFHVTGVQTCALPIYLPFGFSFRTNFTPRYEFYERYNHESAAHQDWGRSEERRVGKECRARRSPYQSKKSNWIGMEAVADS